ncbi:MAG TPA: poly-gamma-glutamate biosynthesis protein PgsC/CapC, partial [Candidatus Krumholzibacteria bacterium]|nr:poly-gamma-glutamate biosynthesis protein PgsC/CapC [Candidatus Krumholzibacteria bacterium]
MSLVFSEILGLAAGGLVVPGYIALYLDQPLRVLSTILVAL